LVEIKAERWIKPKVIAAESAVNSVLQWIVQAAANLQRPLKQSTLHNKEYHDIVV